MRGLYKKDNGDGTYEYVDHIVVNEFPPNIEEVRKKFPLKGGEIFAWDGIIYHPRGGRLPPELIEHEKVHFAQQGGNPEVWWSRYLSDDDEWRLEQELEAHIVEYRTYCRYNRDRNKRMRYLHMIARRLASPMYGGLITTGEARRRILGNG